MKGCPYQFQSQNVLVSFCSDSNFALVYSCCCKGVISSSTSTSSSSTFKPTTTSFLCILTIICVCNL